MLAEPIGDHRGGAMEFGQPRERGIRATKRGVAGDRPMRSKNGGRVAYGATGRVGRVAALSGRLLLLAVWVTVGQRTAGAISPFATTISPAGPNLKTLPEHQFATRNALALRSARTRRRHMLASLLGPGTFISGLHAANKALICWCSEPVSRDTVVKVADVGFLGLLGSLSVASASAASKSRSAGTLSIIQPLILQTAFSHLFLEMLFNGIAIPAMCASEVDPRNEGCEAELSARQAIMQKAVRGNVAQNKTGLRKDIWLHHILAVTAFLIVLTTGEFEEEATWLTSVECTCALPVAFGQAAKAKQLKGPRSTLLAILMCAGFTLRVWLTAKLTLPRVLELLSTLIPCVRPAGLQAPLKTVSGQVLAGAITAPHRLLLVGCSFGLTVLNCIWLCKIVGGICKVVTKGRLGREARERADKITKTSINSADDKPPSKEENK